MKIKIFQILLRPRYQKNFVKLPPAYSLRPLNARRLKNYYNKMNVHWCRFCNSE